MTRRDEIGEGEIRRQGDRPAERQDRFVQCLDDAKIDQGRDNAHTE